MNSRKMTETKEIDGVRKKNVRKKTENKMEGKEKLNKQAVEGRNKWLKYRSEISTTEFKFEKWKQEPKMK